MFVTVGIYGRQVQCNATCVRSYTSHATIDIEDLATATGIEFGNDVAFGDTLMVPQQADLNAESLAPEEGRISIVES